MEKAKSYNWTNDSIQFFFDLANAPQIAAMAPLNTTSTLFFPPFEPNKEFTENLAGFPVKANGTLVYRSGTVEVKWTG